MVAKYGNPTEKAEVRSKVHDKYPDIGSKKHKALKKAIGSMYS